jgi:hypothetical protein
MQHILVTRYDDGVSPTTISSESLPTSGSDSSATANIAVIVGPAVAIPFAVILGFGIYLYVRRRRSKRSFKNTPINPLLTPYMVEPGPRSISEVGNTSAYNSTTSYTTLHSMPQSQREKVSFPQEALPHVYDETFGAPHHDRKR